MYLLKNDIFHDVSIYCHLCDSLEDIYVPYHYVSVRILCLEKKRSGSPFRS